MNYSPKILIFLRNLSVGSLDGINMKTFIRINQNSPHLTFIVFRVEFGFTKTLLSSLSVPARDPLTVVGTVPLTVGGAFAVVLGREWDSQ